MDEAVAGLLKATFVEPQLPEGVAVATGVLVGGAAPVAPAVRVGVDVSAGKVPLPLCVGGVVAPEAPAAVGGTGVVVAVGTGVLVAVGTRVLVGTRVAVGVGGGDTTTLVRLPTTPPVGGLQFWRELGVPVLKSTMQLSHTSSPPKFEVKPE